MVYVPPPQEQEAKARAHIAGREDDIVKPALKRHRVPRVKEKMTLGKMADWLLVGAILLFGLFMLVLFLAVL